MDLRSRWRKAHNGKRVCILGPKCTDYRSAPTFLSKTAPERRNPLRGTATSSFTVAGVSKTGSTTTSDAGVSRLRLKSSGSA
eukprot:scaffold4473_cov421-Prasinococcus_capsulatus_cf.AAC.9